MSGTSRGQQFPGPGSWCRTWRAPWDCWAGPGSQGPSTTKAGGNWGSCGSPGHQASLGMGTDQVWPVTSAQGVEITPMPGEGNKLLRAIIDYHGPHNPVEETEEGFLRKGHIAKTNSKKIRFWLG